MIKRLISVHLLMASLITLFLCHGLTAQSTKAPLDHSVYDGWNQIQRPQLSADGRWVAYELNPQRGDGALHLLNWQAQITDTIARGSQLRFSPDSGFAAFLIKPEEEVVRQARVDGKKEEEMPRDHLGIYRFHDQRQELVENVRSFALAEEASPWLAIHLARMPGDTLEGTQLIILNPLTGEEQRFERVSDYVMSGNGQMVAFVDHATDNGLSRLQLYNTTDGSLALLFEGQGKIQGLTPDAGGSQLAFLHGDQQGETGHFSLYYWRGGLQEPRAVAAPGSAELPRGWGPSRHAAMDFSGCGQRLFFGSAPIPGPEPDDSLLPDEKYRVDVWHYRDPLIQPMQLVRAERERQRSYRAVYHIDEQRVVQLAGEDMPELSTHQYGDGRWEMGWSKLPYLIPNSFESGDYRDVYLVDVLTGERQLVLEKHRGSVHLSTAGDPRLSPGGRYLIYYDQATRHWYSLSLATWKKVNMTAAIPYPLYDELHDTPSEPDPYGVATWTEGDGHVLLYDRFDIWKVDPAGIEAPVSLTGDYGRENGIRFRYLALDRDKEYVGARERMMLSAFNLYTKQSGFYGQRADRPGQTERLVMDDVRYFRPRKAGDAEVLLWQKSSFTNFPDLWVSDMRFSNPRRLSTANPQQADYRWGSVELVEWVSFANDSLQGLLYLPDDMDPEKKYPMIVYFYERSSDGLHLHQVPSPSRSTINRSYYVSNGYIIFVPDIRYRIGYPGQSAYDAIVSGTKAMLNRYDFIDRDRLALQGQSWAGYQIAWLITRTDLFRAAMAGAPVSNMISAYGGIRWVTGMSRIYQYEETQSRIGGTIWDKTLRYIENSPVFFADRVNTPLLMMHNDADGAVPWTQGIEYFMALRRLDKPVWMLNYNDEAHNLTRRPNMVDLSIRMQQFFDHYLKDESMPPWMKYGIPAVKKGRMDAYE